MFRFIQSQEKNQKQNKKKHFRSKDKMQIESSDTTFTLDNLITRFKKAMMLCIHHRGFD